MDTPSVEQLLKKIKELEIQNAPIKDKLVNQKTSLGSYAGPILGYGKQISQYVLFERSILGEPSRTIGGSSSFRHTSPTAQGERSRHDPFIYLSILQSMGQSVHIFDSNDRVIYWNKMAEQLYGYSASEALGKIGTNLIADTCNYDDAAEIINRNAMGETWTGQFPVRNKLGQRFIVMATNTPFYDDLGNFVGIISVATDSQFFLPQSHQNFQPSSATNPTYFSDEPCLPTSTIPDLAESQQPLQVVIASKISNLGHVDLCTMVFGVARMLL